MTSSTDSDFRPVCPRCGADAGSAGFCSGCGLNLRAEARLPSADEYAQQTRQQWNTPVAAPAGGGTAVKIGVIAAVVLIVIAIVAIGLTVALSSGGSSPTTARVASNSNATISVSISSPSNGSKIHSDRVTVRGTVQPGDATVLVQGVPAAVGNGIFTGDASLHAGTNRIDVLVTAPHGVPLQRIVTVSHPGPAAKKASKAPAKVIVIAPQAARSSGRSPGARLPRRCDQNITASTSTSCSFAANVFKAYAASVQSGGATSTVIDAYSPAIQTTIAVACDYDGTTVTCAGGDDARVNFPKWAADVY